jgi:hypothetical protein
LKSTLLENAIALLSKITFPCSNMCQCLFLECLLQILRFDSICRLIVKDQQHAPVFATFSHNKLELALDESGSTRNSIPHTSVTLSYTCSDFTQTADHGYRRSKDSALLPELE